MTTGKKNRNSGDRRAGVWGGTYRCVSTRWRWWRRSGSPHTGDMWCGHWCDTALSSSSACRGSGEEGRDKIKDLRTILPVRKKTKLQKSKSASICFTWIKNAEMKPLHRNVLRLISENIKPSSESVCATSCSLTVGCSTITVWTV